MRNYQVITDKDKLIEFINWLPTLGESEQYYCALLARSKYTKDIEGKNGIPHVSSDKVQLKRFTSTKERLLSKIQQLECPLDSYLQKTIIVPQEALALYISINPRDLWKATQSSLLHFAKMCTTNAYTANPQAEAMSEIQRSVGKKYYTIADLDSKDRVKLGEVLNHVNVDACKVLETRGGYHIIIDPKKVHHSFQHTWYKNIESHPDIDQIGDMMIPVPGTYQGGWTPKFI